MEFHTLCETMSTADDTIYHMGPGSPDMADFSAELDTDIERMENDSKSSSKKDENVCFVFPAGSFQLRENECDVSKTPLLTFSGDGRHRKVTMANLKGLILQKAKPALKTICCSQCGMVFKKPSDLINHLTIEHMADSFNVNIDDCADPLELMPKGRLHIKSEPHFKSVPKHSSNRRHSPDGRTDSVPTCDVSTRDAAKNTNSIIEVSSTVPCRDKEKYPSPRKGVTEDSSIQTCRTEEGKHPKVLAQDVIQRSSNALPTVVDALDSSEGKTEENVREKSGDRDKVSENDLQSSVGAGVIDSKCDISLKASVASGNQTCLPNTGGSYLASTGLEAVTLSCAEVQPLEGSTDKSSEILFSVLNSSLKMGLQGGVVKSSAYKDCGACLQTLGDLNVQEHTSRSADITEKFDEVQKAVAVKETFVDTVAARTRRSYAKKLVDACAVRRTGCVTSPLSQQHRSLGKQQKSSSLNCHNKKQHKLSSVCDVCGLFFVRRSSLYRHMRDKHPKVESAHGPKKPITPPRVIHSDPTIIKQTKERYVSPSRNVVQTTATPPEVVPNRSSFAQKIEKTELSCCDNTFEEGKNESLDQEASVSGLQTQQKSPFTCKQCSQTFALHDSLIRHMRMKHSKAISYDMRRRNIKQCSNDVSTTVKSIKIEPIIVDAIMPSTVVGSNAGDKRKATRSGEIPLNNARKRGAMSIMCDQCGITFGSRIFFRHMKEEHPGCKFKVLMGNPDPKVGSPCCRGIVMTKNENIVRSGPSAVSKTVTRKMAPTFNSLDHQAPQAERIGNGAIILSDPLKISKTGTGKMVQAQKIGEFPRKQKSGQYYKKYSNGNAPKGQEEKQLKCDVCELSFATTFSFYKHAKQAHSIVQTSKSGVRNDYIMHSPKPNKLFYCHVCGSSFTSTTNFYRHMKYQHSLDKFNFRMGKPGSKNRTGSYSTNLSSTSRDMLDRHHVISILEPKGSLGSQITKCFNNKFGGNVSKGKGLQTLKKFANPQTSSAHWVKIVDTVKKQASAAEENDSTETSTQRNNTSMMNLKCHVCKVSFTRTSDFYNHMLALHPNLFDNDASKSDIIIEAFIQNCQEAGNDAIGTIEKHVLTEKFINRMLDVELLVATYKLSGYSEQASHGLNSVKRGAKRKMWNEREVWRTGCVRAAGVKLQPVEKDETKRRKRDCAKCESKEKVSIHKRANTLQLKSQSGGLAVTSCDPDFAEKSHKVDVMPKSSNQRKADPLKSKNINLGKHQTAFVKSKISQKTARQIINEKEIDADHESISGRLRSKQSAPKQQKPTG